MDRQNSSPERDRNGPRQQSRFRLPRSIRIVRGHFRLATGFATSLAVGFLLPDEFRVTTKLLIAWNAGIWVYFALSAPLVVNATPQSLRINAKATDEGKVLILVLTSLAAGASIGAIGVQLGVAQSLAGTEKVLHVGLAAVTIVSAWLLIHLVFAFHYAHEYYDEFEARPGKPAALRGGLVFPETQNPDYLDFIYFSYVVGTSAQTADISVSSRAMRRTVIIHCVLAFFFNSAILALTINLAAGLIPSQK
jgi:uncharacterized membrane protein